MIRSSNGFIVCTGLLLTFAFYIAPNFSDIEIRQIIDTSPRFAEAQSSQCNENGFMAGKSIRCMLSSNWAGHVIYLSSKNNNSFSLSTMTNVSGSWNIPKLSCRIGQDTFSSVWIGIGGYPEGDDDTIVQIGTDHDCINGKQIDSVWIETNDDGKVTQFLSISNLRIENGDQIAASIEYDFTLNQYSFHIVNVNKDTKFYHNYHDANYKRYQSAEWIVETTYLNKYGILPPLSDFGTIQFTNIHFHATCLEPACETYASYTMIHMLNPWGAKAMVSNIMNNGNGSSFNVKYVPW